MFAVKLKRWWGKNAPKVVGAGLALGAGGFLWYNHSSLVWEVYHALSLPLQADAPPSSALVDSRVQNLEAELAEAKAQNQQLRKTLAAPSELPTDKIPAPVIGRSADNWWQHLFLGRGSKAGIEVGAIVLSDGGIVGRVTQVTPNTSQVLLATDPTSRIGVLVSRSRHMGYIQGSADRSDLVTLQFFDKTPDVKVGDTIATSNVSQLFPGGLAVGQVMEVNLQKLPAPEAKVKLTAPISSLEWVRVYNASKIPTPAPQPSTP